MLENFRDTKLEETTRHNISDLSIIKNEIRVIQATHYCGDLVLNFKQGVLNPIYRLNQTKKIK